MTLAQAHESAMCAYVRARVLEGWLPEGAARDAIETWMYAGVPVARDAVDRQALLQRLAVAGADVYRRTQGEDE